MILQLMLVPYWLWLHACIAVPTYILTGETP